MDDNFFKWIAELSLRCRGQGPGFALASTNMVPSYFHRKIEENRTKRIPSCLIPHLLAVFTLQLEILMTKPWESPSLPNRLQFFFFEQKA